jgi:hypothetical protein
MVAQLQLSTMPLGGAAGDGQSEAMPSRRLPRRAEEGLAELR